MSEKLKKFYITTAIDYPTGDPHIGHAYEKAMADIIARWHRLLGKKVFFLTGTDEHGLKVQKRALQQGLSSKQYVDKMSKKFKELCVKWNISNTRFIRTTEKSHEKTVKSVFLESNKNNDIYLGEYSGLYCTDCEAYYLEKDLVNGFCPVHKKRVELLKEESYFFRLSKYRNFLFNRLKKNKKAILPAKKAREIMERIEREELRDLSVSRTTFDWGIKVPLNKKHVIYVWFDALTNYLSGVDYLDKKKFNYFWPADIHLIGKDILWFHSVIWWSILKSAKIKLPRTVFVHGFIKSSSGEKMSKSLGNVVNPLELAEKYPVDSIRYYLAKEIPFGEDGFFSEQKLVEKHNQELANDLGNLVNRILAMLKKYCNSVIPKAGKDRKLEKKLSLKLLKKQMQNLELHHALTTIMAFVKEANKYLNEKQPWKQSEKQRNKTLYNTAEAVRIAAILLHAFTPSYSEKILAKLHSKKIGLKYCGFGLLKPGTKVSEPTILFPKLKIKELSLPSLKYFVEPRIEKDLQGLLLEVKNLEIKRRTSKLEKLKKSLLKDVDLKKLVLCKKTMEYKKLMKKKDFGERPSTILLAEHFEKNKCLPNFNTLTDLYNLLSLKTGIIMGAYDKKKFKNSIYLKKATGREFFIPLGKKTPEKIVKGELVYTDENNMVVTRLLSKQSEKVKTDLNTREAAIIIQGNKAIKRKELIETAEMLSKLLKEVCNAKTVMVKPLVLKKQTFKE